MFRLDLVSKRTLIVGPVVNGRVAAIGLVHVVVFGQILAVVLNIAHIHHALEVEGADDEGNDQADDGGRKFADFERGRLVAGGQLSLRQRQVVQCQRHF